MTRSCGPHPELVGGRYWLPVEPSELGWARLVGCNHLGCTRCGERVRQWLLADPKYRHYECGCQRREEVWRHLVEADPDDLTGVSGWRCLGHPELRLPAVIDGVSVAEDGDWAAVARTGLAAAPPFVPPGTELRAPWVTRLYRLLVSEPAGARLGAAIAALLDDPDPILMGGALDFFINEPAAAGAERLAGVVPRRRAWLAATGHPRYHDETLLDVAATVLHERLLVRDEQRGPVDGPALTVAKALALDGIGPTIAPFTFADYDAPWLWTHAADLVRANNFWLDGIVHVSWRTEAAVREPALRAIAGLGNDTARALAEAIDSTPYFVRHNVPIPLPPYLDT